MKTDNIPNLLGTDKHIIFDWENLVYTVDGVQYDMDVKGVNSGYYPDRTPSNWESGLTEWRFFQRNSTSYSLPNGTKYYYIRVLNGDTIDYTTLYNIKNLLSH